MNESEVNPATLEAIEHLLLSDAFMERFAGAFMNTPLPTQAVSCGRKEQYEHATDDVVLMPLDEPVAIDAIKCRLRQDAEYLHPLCSEVAVPKNEVLWIADVLDAVRACVREWEPNETEKARGAGTGVGMRAAEDRLILIARRDPYRP